MIRRLKERPIEMGGLLLGTVYEGLSGPDDFIIEIANFVRSIDFGGTSVSPRMDSEVWERARKLAEGRTVVGCITAIPISVSSSVARIEERNALFSINRTV
jgi:hypothetical protein